MFRDTVFLVGDIHLTLSYRIYISQLVRDARDSFLYFNDVIFVLPSVCAFSKLGPLVWLPFVAAVCHIYFLVVISFYYEAVMVSFDFFYISGFFIVDLVVGFAHC